MSCRIAQRSPALLERFVEAMECSKLPWKRWKLPWNIGSGGSFHGRYESFHGRKDVVRRPQADMLIDELFVQQMRADGEQKGVIEVGLIIT